jgi:hypothetical protein
MRHQQEWKDWMYSGISPINSAAASTNTLAFANAAVAQSDGDFTTAIPALSLHRRNMPTAPMHCIYGPGQSMLTTVELRW